MSVCIISPTATVREALSKLVTTIGFEVAPDAGSASAAVVDLTSHRSNLPEAPALPSLAILNSSAPELVEEAREAGYAAVILPEDGESRPRHAFTSLKPRPPLPARPTASMDDGTTDEPLTERERQVMNLLMLGLTNKRIAQHLRITERTVKFHVAGLLRKHSAATRLELMLKNPIVVTRLPGRGATKRSRSTSS
jgi:DNA-binding CsgD family transcriptional regulator